MPEARRNLGEKLVDFLEYLGLDPMYSLTVIVIVVALSYSKDLKNFDELVTWRKGIIVSTIFAAAVFTILSILRMIGLFNL